MIMKKKEIIAIEEHYIDQILYKEKFENTKPNSLEKKLLDIGQNRINHMNDSGIDIQILSHNHPSVQNLETKIALKTAQEVNNNLYKCIQIFPQRFRGFASLPTQIPIQAADELERSVSNLNFCGGMLHGMPNGQFIDEEFFWPIFERAQKLDVPIYIHPGFPHKNVIDTYYKKYAQTHPMILTAGWGFTFEAATTAIRLILSGIFSHFPKLKIILGHMGEGIPFLLWRIHTSFAERGAPNIDKIDFKDIFINNFYITTSGNFSDTALNASIMEIGINKIIFAVDYPYNDSKRGVDWILNSSISDIDKNKICSLNARNLLFK